MVKKRAAISCGLILLAVITACGSSLRVEPGEGAGSHVCVELGRVLPVSIEGALLRSTHPDSPGTKAWGDPAIVMRCGVAEPMTYSATSQLLVVNGVSWYPEELQAGVRFTSLQTPELVEVSIPDAYQSTADILTQLSSDLGSLAP